MLAKMETTNVMHERSERSLFRIAFEFIRKEQESQGEVSCG